MQGCIKLVWTFSIQILIPVSSAAMRVMYLLAISDKENITESWQRPHWRPRRLQEDNGVGRCRDKNRRHSQDRVLWRKWTSTYSANGVNLEELLIHQPVNKFLPKVHHCAYNCPPLDPSRLNPFLTSPPRFLQIRLMFASQSRLGIPRWIFPRGSWITFFCKSDFPTHETFHVHYIPPF